MSRERTREEEELRVYRALYPLESHRAFLAAIRAVESGNVPGPTSRIRHGPKHVPLFHDASLSDSQKHFFELRYVQRIFQSWLKQYPHLKQVGLTAATILKRTPIDGVTTLIVEYRHDRLLYKSYPRIGVVARADDTLEYFLRIPVSNNGYSYRMMPQEQIERRDVVRHRGFTHEAGIPGFAQLHHQAASDDFGPFVKFACAFLGCRSKDISQEVYYNGSANRVDVFMVRRNYPIQGNKFSITICFEPGWPIDEPAEPIDMYSHGESASDRDSHGESASEVEDFLVSLDKDFQNKSGEIEDEDLKKKSKKRAVESEDVDLENESKRARS